MSRWWRAVSLSFWLGWKVESNWIDPRLFFFYAILRPVAGALILVFMYVAVTSRTAGEMLGYLVVGAAFWPLVLAGVRGGVMAVLEDREQHQTAGMLYTAPVSHRAYVVGRALAQMTAIGVASAIVTLLIGRLGLGVHYELSLARAATLFLGMLLGIAGLLALTIIVMSIAINLSGESWNMPEGINAALYLVSGAIFPIAILPFWLAAIARALPITWWLELMRRALLPAGGPSSFSTTSDAGVLTGLTAVTAVWLLGAAIIGRTAENHARYQGILDSRSGY